MGTESWNLEKWIAAFRGTTMTKRELEHHLQGAGLSKKHAMIVASKCGRPLVIVKKPGLFRRIVAAI